jgi:hypothetical protein
MDVFDGLMQLLANACPGEHPPLSYEEQKACLAKAERELLETKRTLCELIAWIQQQGLASEELNAILERYDRFLHSIAKAEAGAMDLVNELDRLLAKGDDLAALRLYHKQTHAVWDRCHSLLELWPHLSREGKQQEVLKDVRFQ